MAMGLKDKAAKRTKESPFVPALLGLFHAARTERNFQFHLFAGTCVVVLGFLFSLSKTEWMIIILVIFGMLSLELVNTAIERTVDLVTLERHPLAKQAKDVAAAAVFVYAFMAVIIACIIFIPKILLLF